ncbi:MAG TPA: efflux RND transporter periplasmic adaptor subunit [Anaeromyxobacteraceae bacterium]|nr:efflux RND transporter periplasmic adaptor subunit [Anaeromyxobacteraceae bacterium]
MHPTVAQDHRGDCPVCGMKLVPVHGADTAVSGAEPGRALALPPGKQGILGIAVVPVQRSARARSLRALGRVAPDEARLYKLNAGANGSIRDVASVVTGSRVRKDQVLGSFYAPDTISVTQLFILNTQGYARKKVRGANDAVQGEKGDDEADVGRNNSSLQQANIQQRIMQLENYGISARQRDEIMRSGRVPETIQIVAPADGVVLARNVFPGLKFDRGFEFYRIADLRRVWVLADVFPHDARHVRVGARAQVSVPEQGIALRATVAEILPQFDMASRTLKVRLEVDNPGSVLRPDMFVDVEWSVALPAAITVPSDAVVDSGRARRVFVETGAGAFEPRDVETGWRSGDVVEIVRGLSPGERVVTSGAFFLDSETRMRAPTSRAAAAARVAPVPTGSAPEPLGGAGPSLPPRDRLEAAHVSAGRAP